MGNFVERKCTVSVEKERFDLNLILSQTFLIATTIRFIHAFITFHLKSMSFSSDIS